MDYSLVYFHHGLVSKNKLPLSWMWGLYKVGSNSCFCSLHSYIAYNFLKPTPSYRVTALIFGMAVTILMFIKELWRKGGRTAANAENRNLVSKRVFFEEKNKIVSNAAKTFNLARNFRWQVSTVAAVLPPFLHGFAAVSSQSLINIIKATTIPNISVVTLFLAEFLRWV